MSLTIVIVTRPAVLCKPDDAEAVMMVMTAMLDLRRQQMQAFAENRNTDEDRQQKTAQKSSMH